MLSLPDVRERGARAVAATETGGTMKRISLLLAGLVALGVAGIASASASHAARPVAAMASAPVPSPAASPRNQINFFSACRFDHRGPDDPIVHPDMPGMSHSHDFFGNVSTNAASTYTSMRAATTSCSRPGDTAGYWVPTLLLDGQNVDPIGINAYYRMGGKDPSSIQPFPAGLKVVAGDAKATGPQSPRITHWGCRGTTQFSVSTVPTCPPSTDRNPTRLTLSVRFPDCWNGHDLDSADHKSHMAYSVRGVCPAGYAVPVPALTVHVRYAIAGGAGVTLASGAPYTAHADFFNAWNQAALTTLVNNCMVPNVQCGARGITAR
jgi:hypothetical protein